MINISTWGLLITYQDEANWRIGRIGVELNWCWRSFAKDAEQKRLCTWPGALPKMDCHLVISSICNDNPSLLKLLQASTFRVYLNCSVLYANFTRLKLWIMLSSRISPWSLDSFFCARATDSSHLLPLVTLCKSHNILARDYHSWVCQHENGQYISAPKRFPCSKARYFQPEHIL